MTSHISPETCLNRVLRELVQAGWGVQPREDGREILISPTHRDVARFRISCDTRGQIVVWLIRLREICATADIPWPQDCERTDDSHRRP